MRTRAAIAMSMTRRGAVAATSMVAPPAKTRLMAASRASEAACICTVLLRIARVDSISCDVSEEI